MKRISLTDEQLRQLVRYDIDIRALPGFMPGEEYALSAEGSVSMTLEDLLQALQTLREKDPTAEELGAYWLLPMAELRIPTGLAALLELDDTPETLREYRGLNLSTGGRAWDVWSALDGCIAFGEEDTERLSEVLNMEKLADTLERFLADRGKPIEEWRFTEEERASYVSDFGGEERLAEAAENELSLCRRFIEELIPLDNETALRVKAYACYGGDRLYECDWRTSRACLERLNALDDDPHYANTLGYICYYGRCNGGVPEYEAAFRYFGYAAANGLYEGMYKLADLYRHGYGCRKSPRTACRLYEMVYDDTLGAFLLGQDTSFADAALRMGDMFAEGLRGWVSPQQAYDYYLQADYAAWLRAEKSEFFGNTTVAVNIRRALERTEAELPEDFFREYVEYDLPSVFDWLTGNGCRCVLRLEQDEGNGLRLTAERLPRQKQQILLTVPELRLCVRTQKISLRVSSKVRMWFRDDADEIRFDRIENNFEDNCLEFYEEEQRVAWCGEGRYRLCAPPRVKTGPEYRLASVCFVPGGHCYDYLCEEDVRPGDTVIINGYDGLTEVTVTEVFTRCESELGLPPQHYKRILRKK